MYLSCMYMYICIYVHIHAQMCVSLPQLVLMCTYIHICDCTPSVYLCTYILGRLLPFAHSPIVSSLLLFPCIHWCAMPADVLIVSLVYVDRLLDKDGITGALPIQSWRPVLVACLVHAPKQLVSPVCALAYM